MASTMQWPGFAASDTPLEVLLKLSRFYGSDPEFVIADTYTNFLVPLTLVIDRAGVVRYIHTGFEPGAEKQYEAAVVKALGL